MIASVLGGQDGLTQGATGSSGVQPDLGGQLGADG